MSEHTFSSLFLIDSRPQWVNLQKMSSRFFKVQDMMRTVQVATMQMELDVVFLSAFFWLPFFHNGDAKDPDLDSEFQGYNIVASFMLEKPLPFLED